MFSIAETYKSASVTSPNRRLISESLISTAYNHLHRLSPCRRFGADRRHVAEPPNWSLMA